MRTKTNLMIGLVFIILLVFAVIYLRNSIWVNDRNYLPTDSEATEQVMPDLSPQEAERIIKEPARQVIQLIKDKDFKSLSKWIHPDQGVRFSQNGYVDTKEDVVFTADQIKNYFNDDQIYTWTYVAGTGVPIKRTPREYYNVLYFRDFANAPKIFYNKYFEESHAWLNQFKVYPHAIMVEYYVPGTDPIPEFAGLYWGSLQLVFQPKDDQWYLVGIINCYSTI